MRLERGADPIEGALAGAPYLDALTVAGRAGEEHATEAGGHDNTPSARATARV